MAIFNAIEEFLRELSTDTDIIERKIVRVTNLRQPSKLTPVIQHLFVVATYKAARDVVECKQYAGDLWNREQDQKVIEKKSIALQTHIKGECRRLGLEVRAGMYTERED